MKLFLEICKLSILAGIATGQLIGSPAQSSGNANRKLILCIDRRLLKVIENQIGGLKTEDDVRRLFGKPDNRLQMDDQILLCYNWEPLPNTRINISDDESRVFLSGVTFKINSKSGKVLNWSWGYTVKFGKMPAEK